MGLVITVTAQRCTHM